MTRQSYIMYKVHSSHIGIKAGESGLLIHLQHGGGPSCLINFRLNPIQMKFDQSKIWLAVAVSVPAAATEDFGKIKSGSED